MHVALRLGGGWLALVCGGGSYSESSSELLCSSRVYE